MKILAAMGASFVVLTTCAWAADPTVSVDTGYNWSGFYAGVNIGHAGHRTGFEDPEYDWYGSTFYLNEDGFAYGIQGGYNWQQGAAVYGIEGDFSGLTNSASTIFSSDNAIENDVNWMASLRGRVGLGLDRTLVYLTGGLAVADFDRSWIETNDADDSWPDLGDTKFGVIGGFGVEHAFSSRWTARFEGLLARFGENTTVNDNDYPLLTSDTIATARLAINYRFGEMPDAGIAPYTSGTPSDFSGFYVGGNLGGAFDIVSQTDIDYYEWGATYDHRSEGFTGGGQIGFNVQDGAGLYGVVADFNLFSNSNAKLYYDPDDPEYEIRTGINWMASLRAKAGLVAGNSLMYLTGGVALADFDSEVDGRPYDDPYWDMSGTEIGLIVGGGFEQKFTNNVSGFVEATFAAFPGSTVYGSGDGDDAPYRGAGQVTSVRTGINYRFGGAEMSDGVEMPLIDWSGAHAGVETSFAYHNGSIWDRVYYDFGGTYQVPSLGAGFGGHVGYNWQNGSFVYGAVADIEMFTNGETDTAVDYRAVVSELDWLATIRGRAGIASGSTYMYATGGLAIADVDLEYNYLPSPDSSSFDIGGTRTGWVVGLGVEQALTDKVSWKLEGLYSKFRGETAGNGETCSDTYVEPCEMDGFDDNVSIKLGLSYKFGSL
ncbi:outer membrane protein [Mesorhizobium sp. 10J20-29]